jgi:hypothetical protein
MDSRVSQQLMTIRQTEALEQAAAARAARAARAPRPRLTTPRAKVMIAMWRAGSRAR